MQSTLPSFRNGKFFLIVSVFILFFSTVIGNAQTQKPSITTGVTYQWSDTQTNNNDPATISSITVDGTIYNSFAAPTSYVLTRLGPDGHSDNDIVNNGTIVNNSSANADWNTDALAAFQDKNLNHYFTSNDNGRDICNDFVAVAITDAQIQSLYYASGIPSNDGGVLAITERNANNCYYIAVYGYPVGSSVESFLGDTFVRENSTQWGSAVAAPPAGVDYWNSGRVVENGGALGIALFSLKDLAPVGSIITRVDLVAATQDHGDGKVFICEQYAAPKTETGCLDQEFNGTVNDGSAPLGSTYSIVSGPTPAGQAFTFNSDGTYSYTPTAGFLGTVTFDYEVCLPTPNTSICDTATVNLEYVTYPHNGCPCNSGDAAGPLLQNN